MPHLQVCCGANARVGNRRRELVAREMKKREGLCAIQFCDVHCMRMSRGTECKIHANAPVHTYA